MTTLSSIPIGKAVTPLSMVGRLNVNEILTLFFDTSFDKWRDYTKWWVRRSWAGDSQWAAMSDGRRISQMDWWMVTLLDRHFRDDSKRQQQTLEQRQRLQQTPADFSDSRHDSNTSPRAVGVAGVSLRLLSTCPRKSLICCWRLLRLLLAFVEAVRRCWTCSSVLLESPEVDQSTSDKD